MQKTDRTVTDGNYSRVTEYLKSNIQAITGKPVKRSDETRNIMDLGIDSIGLVSIADNIRTHFGIDLPPTVFFEYQSISDLSRHLQSQSGNPGQIVPAEIIEASRESTVADESHAESVSSSNEDGLTLDKVFDHFWDTSRSLSGCNAGAHTTGGQSIEDIAVIGMAGKFAGSRNLDEFWKNLCGQKDLFSEIPADHFEYKSWCADNRDASDAMYCTRGSFIDDVDKFDAAFFNIPPQEAAIIDPQLRHLLEVIYHTIEDAGYANKIRGTNTGMYVGACFHDYELELVRHLGEMSPYFGIGNALTMLANRPSFYLDLKGPSLPLDTACSASLVAINTAMAALRNGECDMAFVAGTNLLLSPLHFRYFCTIGALSRSGGSYPFDSRADGYLPGEAVGAVLLKPLSRAKRDGDRIHAVIKSAAVNHGGYSASFTAPSVTQEAAVIEKALKAGNIPAESISYLEAHGTGTSLGDPIEVNGLKLAFREVDHTKYSCALTTAKAHIGHAEGAAGIAGLLKVILSMKHKTIPAMPHLRELNPYVNLADTPFVIHRSNQHWSPNKGYPRRAGISSFGIGGAYAHVVVEEYITTETTVRRDEAPAVFVVSARSKERLMAYAGNLATYIGDRYVNTVSRITLEDLSNLTAKATGNRIYLHNHKALVADLGLRPGDFVAISEAMEKDWSVRMSPRSVALHYTVADWLHEINHSYSESMSAGMADFGLQDLAYTMQVGREAMSYRLAIVSDSRDGLIDQLTYFSDNGEPGKSSFYNMVSDDQDLDDFLGCPEGEGYILSLARAGRLPQLAKLWVKGAIIPWKDLPGQEYARMANLPAYPFAQHRYWYSDDPEISVVQEVKPDRKAVAVRHDPDIRHLLSTVWLKYLSVERIQESDNFIALGGTSITTTQVVAEINRKLLLSMTVGEFGQCATFGDVCALVKQKTAAVDSRPVTGEFMIPVSGQHQSVPLSPDQLRLWVLSQMYPNNTRHNISSAYRIDGSMDTLLLQKSLDSVVARNASLRTVFASDQGAPSQTVLGQQHVSLDYHELPDHESPYDIINASARSVFDLANGPLLKVMLIKAPDHYLLSIVVHHIVADISSCDVIARDLIKTYSSLHAGSVQDNGPSSNGQFNDYVVWANAQNNDVRKSDISFWNTFLDGAPTTLNLPFDYPRQAHQSFRSEQVSLDMDSQVYAGLDTVARELRVTRFVLVFAAFNLLMARICRQNDLLVGVPNANRSLPDTRNMIGFLAKTMVLRSRIDFHGTLVKLIEDTKNNLFAAFDHLSVGYGDIVSSLGIASPKNHNPLFQVLFNMMERDESLFTQNDLALAPVDLPLITLDFDALFTVDVRNNRLRMFMDFNPDLFKSQTAKNILESFHAILRDICSARPDAGAYNLTSTPLSIDPASMNAGRKGKMVVAATFTAEPVAASIQFWLDKLQMNYELEFSPYNQVFQGLLDPSSLLNQNGNGMNLVLVRYDDWLRFDVDTTTAPAERKRRIFNEFSEALRASAGMHGTPMILTILPADGEDSELHAELNRELAGVVESLPSVHLLDAGSITQAYPVVKIFDAVADKAGHVPYKSDYFTALGTSLVRKARSVTTLPYKVLVLDCDNTLWQGVVGEVGANGIVLDAARKNFQEFLKSQAEHGMLLCLASKNVEDDVMSVFNAHPEMPLKLNDILTWKVNWEPKYKNLEILGEELNLGLDSFIFIDDNPVECAEVEAMLPQVLTLQFPQEAVEIERFCRSIWDLDMRSVTSEDKKRTEMYRQNIERNRIEQESSTFEDFISRLELQIDIADVDQESIARVEQLMMRTNQFNSTTRRYTARDINNRITNENYECKTVKVRDRFGDYGLVGVMLYQVNNDHIRLDSIILSCRVLGKGVEHAMINNVARRALDAGIDVIHLEYIESKKNVPLHAFYNSIDTAEWNERDACFTLDSAQAAALRFRPAPVESRNRAASVDEQFVASKSPRTMAAVARELNDLDRIAAAVRASGCNSVQASASHAIKSASNQTERILAGIYSDVLRSVSVDTESSFFDLGGTSLQLVELASRISEEMERNVPITVLFQFPSIVALAGHLSGTGGKSGNKMSKARERAQRQRQMISRLQVA